MSDADTESPLDEGSDDVFDEGHEAVGSDEVVEIPVHESKDDILRRKRIRRLLERRLERKRLRAELDDFVDLDEDAEDLLEDDEDDF